MHNKITLSGRSYAMLRYRYFKTTNIIRILFALYRYRMPDNFSLKFIKFFLRNLKLKAHIEDCAVSRMKDFISWITLAPWATTVIHTYIIHSFVENFDYYLLFVTF
jgi:hypothetical protein